MFRPLSLCPQAGRIVDRHAAAPVTRAAARSFPIHRCIRRAPAVTPQVIERHGNGSGYKLLQSVTGLKGNSNTAPVHCQHRSLDL
jgi:hypothetical protein